MSPRQQQAINDILYAWRVEGPYPLAHQRAKEQLEELWPRLFRALVDLDKCTGWIE